MTLISRVLAVSLLIGVMSSNRASADPIPIIGGTLHTGSPTADFRAVFSLVVEGGTITGEWPQGTVAGINCFGGCLPGATVSPNAIWLKPEVPSEIATPNAVGDVLGAGPFLAGSLLFLGDPLMLPPLSTGDTAGDVTVNQPFRFSGWIAAYPSVSRGPFVPEQLIYLDLIGVGTAQLRFSLNTIPDGRTFYIYRDTTYEFEPVPEPLTLLTVGTGLGLIWRRRRTRRA